MWTEAVGRRSLGSESWGWLGSLLLVCSGEHHKAGGGKTSQLCTVRVPQGGHLCPFLQAGNLGGRLTVLLGWQGDFIFASWWTGGGKPSRWFRMCTKASCVYKHINIHTCACVHAKSLQSCLILPDPMDCGPPGSSVHGILQARILEGVPVPSSRGSHQPRGQTHVSYVTCIGSDSLPLVPPGKPPCIPLYTYLYSYKCVL